MPFADWQGSKEKPSCRNPGRSSAGERIAQHTKALEIRRGVLHIGVANAPMLSELASFHKVNLLTKLKSDYPNLKIRELKFLLKTKIEE